jgi:hypothetical protein
MLRFADLNHEAHLLQLWNELRRRNDPVFGMAPSQQGFHSGDGAQFCRNERLVMENEFVPAEGVTEIIFQLLPEAGCLGKLRRE